MPKKIKIKIDDKVIVCDEGKTVLQAARENNIFVPTLCEHPDLSIKANCRVCVVEIKGRKKLATSCSEMVAEGMEITTNSERVKQSRDLNIELLFAEHIEKCGQCIWRVNCKLLDLAQRYKIKITRFKDRKASRKTYKFANAVEIDGTQCIDCRNCVEACSRQGIDYLEIAGKGIEQEVIPTADKKKSCIYCGQCALHCPVGAAQEQTSWEMVSRDIDYREKMIIAQISPASQISIGEEFGFAAGVDISEKIIGALRQLGFARVFDMTVGNDLAILEESQRLTTKHGNRPSISASCPAGVEYIKSYYPSLVKNLSPVLSPQIINARLIKNYWAKKNKFDPKNIIVVSIVPCTAQKYEAVQSSTKKDGLWPVDYVLTVREIAWMIKRKNIDLFATNSSKFDLLDRDAIGSGFIYELSGGQVEAISQLTKNGSIKMAAINGTGEARNVLDNYKDFDFIEIRACAEGCVGGGGQAVPTTNEKKEKRAEALRKMDKSVKIDKELLNKYRIYF